MGRSVPRCDAEEEGREVSGEVKIKLLNAVDTQRSLARHIEDCEKLRWATAWATENDLVDAVFRNHEKIELFAVGISFSQTDPKVLSRMIGQAQCGYIDVGANRTFHPKAYLFDYGSTCTAIVGSANFTNAGLSRNSELCVELSGPSDNTVFVELKHQLEEWGVLLNQVTPEFLEFYRPAWLAAKNRIPASKPPIWFGAKEDAPLLLSMDWKEFSDRVHDEKLPGRLNQNRRPMAERLNVLEIAQSFLASVQSFGDLDENKRKAIAGTFGHNEKSKAIHETGIDDWSWFGGMSGNGHFKSAVCNGVTRQADPELVTAVDRIPLQGNIERSDFDDFVERVQTGVPGNLDIGTITRLLAIKRPDVFVCVCGGNEVGLSKALGIAVKELRDVSLYWQNVIEPIRSSIWYNEPRPPGAAGQLWDWRAAMVDAAYYGRTN
jgi:HKD family nuclease